MAGGAEEGYVIVDLERSERPVGFRLDARVKLEADKRTRLRAVKDRTLQDYLPGDRLEVTFRTSDSRAVELELKRSDD